MLIKSIRTFIDRRGTVNRALVLASGYAISQGVVLLAMPLLARRFGTADFGLLANLLTVSNIALNLGALRLDHAILVSDTEDDANRLRDAALTLALLWGIVIAAPMLLLSRWGSLWPEYVWLVSTTVLLVTSTQAVAMTLLRQGRIRSVAILRASQGVMFVALALTSGMGLGLSFAFSWILGAMSFLPWALVRPRLGPMISATMRYGRFPMLGSLGTLMDVVGFSVVVWTMSSSFGLADCGRITQAQRLVGAPMLLLALSLGPVLQRSWADDVSAGPVRLVSSFRRACNLLTITAIAWLLVVVLCGPQLTHILLGEGWVEDRWLLAALSAAACARSVVSPLSGILIVRREFKKCTAWQAAYFAIAVVVLPAAASWIDLRSFVFLYSAFEIVMYCTYLVIIRRSLG